MQKMARFPALTPSHHSILFLKVHLRGFLRRFSIKISRNVYWFASWEQGMWLRQAEREKVNLEGEKEGNTSSRVWLLLNRRAAMLPLSPLSAENQALCFSLEIIETLTVASVVGTVLWLEFWIGSCLTNVLLFQNFPMSELPNCLWSSRVLSLLILTQAAWDRNHSGLSTC